MPGFSQTTIIAGGNAGPSIALVLSLLIAMATLNGCDSSASEAQEEAGANSSLKELVDELQKLPDLEQKTAERLAKHILSSPREDAVKLSDAIRAVKAFPRGSRDENRPVPIAASLATSITWVVTRSNHKMARWADTIVFLAPAVPTIVTAIAFQFLGIAIYHWLPLFGTIWLVAIAMGTRMLAYCTRTMNSTSLQIQFELDEVAHVSGVSKLATFRSIFLPLMAPAIFYSALMVGMLSARDLTLPLIMNTGETEVIATLIFNLQTNGEQNAAAAVALYMIFVLVLLALFARRITGMQEIRGTGLRRRRRNWKLTARENNPKQTMREEIT